MDTKPKRKQPGIRHIDRLMDAVLEVVEDPNQSPSTKLDAAKLGFEILKKRSPQKRKTKDEKAVERMLTGPKKQQ